MSTLKAVIEATVAICAMSLTDSRKLLLTILETHSDVVCNSMHVEDSKEYKVILNRNKSEKKIPIIKFIRMVTGMGLGESKAWCEGIMAGDLPSGVVKQHLTWKEANKFMDEWSKEDSFIESGCHMTIVSQDSFVNPLPFSWRLHTDS